MLENLQIEHIEQIERIAENDQFYLPDITSPLTCIRKVLKDENGKIVGSAFVNITCDLTFSVDPNIPEITRAKLLKETIETLKPDLIKKGFIDCQVFCYHESMAKALEKHFGFKRSDGIAMHRRLFDGETN